MTIYSNTPPVHGRIGARRTKLATFLVLAAALVAATLGLHSGLSRAAESAGPPAMAPMGAPPAGAYKLDKDGTVTDILSFVNHLASKVRIVARLDVCRCLITHQGVPLNN